MKAVLLVLSVVGGLAGGDLFLNGHRWAIITTFICAFGAVWILTGWIKNQDQ